MKLSILNDFGNIDIYLFDQLLKGRFENCKNIIDVGCGNGRNMVYFLKNNFDVYGIDQDLNMIEEIKKLSQELAPQNATNNFILADLEEIPFSNSNFDCVICNAVLHFAKNKNNFEKMLLSIWRILKPNGFLFVRLASTIGIESLIKDLGDGRYLLPDNSIRYLVSQEMLIDYTKKLNGKLIEPLKTTNVQNLRCMTTWCLQKNTSDF